MNRVTFKLHEEICNFRFWKAVRTEFLGTLLLVFLGCGTALVVPSSVGYPDQTDCSLAAETGHLLLVALGSGLVVATLTQGIGHISGAHMNPAISLAMLATRNVSAARALFYILGQLVGGLSGAGILFGVARQRLNASLYFVPVVQPDTHPVQAFGVEFMCTFVYAFTLFANLEPRRVEMGSRSLSIGLSVTAGHLVALRFSGAALNPVRSLGPVLITGHWDNHWIYWAGPILGAILGGFTYEYTQDSQSELQYFKRSFRRNRLPRSTSANTTELTFTPSSTFESLRLNT